VKAVRALGRRRKATAARLTARRSIDMHRPSMTNTLRRRMLRNDGQDLLEYAFLMALIGVAAIAGVRTIGATINSAFWVVIANYH
jgi:Flp pilus assembly pilin Flp